MAITIKKYVSINTIDNSSRNRRMADVYFSLLITPESTISSSTDTRIQSLIDDYNEGKIISPTEDEARTLFKEATAPYTVGFITRYYGYLSPQGNSPAEVKFFKWESGDTPQEAYNKAEAQPVTFSAFTFITPDLGDDSSAEDDYFDNLEEVAKVAADAGKMMVVNYVKGAFSEKAIEDANAAKDLATRIQTQNPVVMVYGSNPWSGYMPLAAISSMSFAAGGLSGLMYRMYQDEPAVSDTQVAEILDGANINYLGITQSNGQEFKFYQRGNNLDGMDTAVYIYEVWFKGQCETALIARLASGQPIPANETGETIVDGIVRPICDEAVTNGMFLRFTPSDEQIEYVQSIMSNIGFDAVGDDAAYALSALGYYLTVYQTTSGGEPSIAYIVFYGSGASVKFIQGTDVVVR